MTNNNDIVKTLKKLQREACMNMPKGRVIQNKKKQKLEKILRKERDC